MVFGLPMGRCGCLGLARALAFTLQCVFSCGLPMMICVWAYSFGGVCCVGWLCLGCCFLSCFGGSGCDLCLLLACCTSM